ncbi:type VI secretion system Vgr family protein, partial [Denitromonas iodatirespirans]
TWVRVAEWLAGPNWGSHFLPRIGTDVLVDFIGGDIDRPVIVSQLFTGEDLPPFSAGVDSNANHPGVLSGWTSHNHDSGFNQWLADDAPGQLRTRLASSATNAQLGLGHLIHHAPLSATRGPWRGSGFELRTDAWLAVRAGEGLLLSASVRSNAISTQMDASEALAQLRAAERTAKTLSDAAGRQGAQALAGNGAQTRFIDTIDPAKEGKYTADVGGQPARKAQPGSRSLGEPVERFADPVILAEAPDDIGLTSPASTVFFAAEHLHATVQHDWHLAAAHTLGTTVGQAASWFSHAGGIKSIAAAGRHTLQAHTDALDILADKAATFTSSNTEIRILAKRQIVLKAGQSSVTLSGADITFACPGKFSVKGGGNAFEGPGRGA